MNAYRDQYATLFKDGRGMVLIAISADPDTALASWARDSEYPFLFASDSGLAVARQYGALASEPGLTNRNLFVVGRTGRSPTGRFRSGRSTRRRTRSWARRSSGGSEAQGRERDAGCTLCDALRFAPYAQIPNDPAPCRSSPCHNPDQSPPVRDRRRRTGWRS